jgi:hypothetical protein
LIASESLDVHYSGGFRFGFSARGGRNGKSLGLIRRSAPDRGLDPQATLEARFGKLNGFEGPIEGVQPLHVREILKGAYFQIKLPERKRGQRSARLEPVAVQ